MKDGGIFIAIHDKINSKLLSVHRNAIKMLLESVLCKKLTIIDSVRVYNKTNRLSGNVNVNYFNTVESLMDEYPTAIFLLSVDLNLPSTNSYNINSIFNGKLSCLNRLQMNKVKNNKNLITKCNF